MFFNINNINLEKIFFNNFYIDNYFINSSWYFEFLPEIILIFFILYNLIRKKGFKMLGNFFLMFH